MQTARNRAQQPDRRVYDSWEQDAMPTRNDPHKLLFSPPTLMLGEIHLTLLRSTNLIDKHRESEEMGFDEIAWWVFHKETDHDELRTQTDKVLKSIQVLKEASDKLAHKQPASYEELILSLLNFAESNKGKIEALGDYVRWLGARDPLAPGILFTYRVWGSTRMADRWIGKGREVPAWAESQLIRSATEIVLGICSSGHRVHDVVYGEIQYELMDSVDPEVLSHGSQIFVPDRTVVARTAHEVYINCATYFVEVRDSLRHILLDIAKFDKQRQPIRGDAFWRKFIAKAVASKKAETQLWDFKETLTMWHVKEPVQKERAKVTFAEDVAALANARGGVLVVGVSDQREIVGLGSPSRDLDKRLKALETVVATHVEYPRNVVSLAQVVVPIKDERHLCLVVMVAQTVEPVGVNDGNGKYTYPLRRETGIDRVPRSTLAEHKRPIREDNHDFMNDLRRFVAEN